MSFPFAFLLQTWHELDFSLGSPEDLGRIQGFHALELGPTGSYRWLRGQGTAQLQLEKPIAAEDRLVLRLNAGQAQAVQLSLRLDDGPTQHILVTGGSWRRYIFSLPPSALGSTKLQISLSVPTFVPALRNPDSSDLRRLSLMVSEIKVE